MKVYLFFYYLFYFFINEINICIILHYVCVVLSVQQPYRQIVFGCIYRFFSGLTEIPEWFNHRSPAGSSVKIPLSSNLCDSNSSSGIAFFAISVPPKNLKEDIFRGKKLLLYIKTTCHSDMVGGLEICPQDIYTLKISKVNRNSSFVYGFYIPARKLIDYLDEYSFITVSITSNHPHLDFKCGARKVHVEDLTEFEQIIDNLHLGSSTEDHSVVSCQRYSTQKESLESLLLGLYQVYPHSSQSINIYLFLFFTHS